MPALELHTIVQLIALAVFTVYASVSDLRTRRIPNALTVSAFVAGVAYQATFHGWPGLQTGVAGFALGAGTFFILFLRGGGGGDVKMMGALGMWLGYHGTLAVMAASIVIVLCALWIHRFRSLFTKADADGERNTESAGDEVSASAAEPVAELDSETETDTAVSRRVEPSDGRHRMAFAFPASLATWLVVAYQIVRH